MRFGLALPHYGFSRSVGKAPTFEDVAAWARRAEELGFDSVWMSDHFFYSFARYGADPSPIGSLEPMTTLAGIAAVTSRVRLGTLVLCSAFRNPLDLAHQAETLDAISAGRLELGIGAGWFEQEFRAFGYRFGNVGDRFTDLEGAAEALAGSIGEVPLWFGGKGGPRLLRLAARLGAGWNVVWRLGPADYAAKVADVRAACASASRDPATFRLSIGLYGTIGRDEASARAAFERGRETFPANAMASETWDSWRADTLSGTPQQVLERVHEFEELGVGEIILSPWVLPFAIVEDEQVDMFAREVIGAR
jgi:alkanesulfonate monooxygenase SsuD/methylene tetrahydromethanopterin reductase-like flavin-dependent oxidoreductase (luciferase family)